MTTSLLAELETVIVATSTLTATSIVVALDQTVEIFILGISLATGAGGEATRSL